MELREGEQPLECKTLNNLQLNMSFYWQEMSKFFQPFDNYPNGIKPLWSMRKISDEVHIYHIPFP